MRPSITRSATLFLAIALPACAGTDAADGDGGSSGDGSSSDGGPTTITVSGIARDFVGMIPFVDAEICMHETPSVPCVTTDADGAYTLPGVPPGTEGAFTLTHPDAVSYALWGITPTEDSTLDLTTLDNPSAQLFVMALGGEYDATKAHLALSAADPMGVFFAGVTLTVTPMPAGVWGYVDDSGIPDPTLTETSSAGPAGWANAEAGDYEFTAAHATATCMPPTSAIPGTTAGSIRIPAIAGYLNSAFAFACE